MCNLSGKVGRQGWQTRLAGKVGGGIRIQARRFARKDGFKIRSNAGLTVAAEVGYCERRKIKPTFQGKTMRTIFEDTNAKAEMEEVSYRGNENKYTLLGLWLIAIVFLAGTWGVYRWADSRPAVEPPPPPVSLDDPKQTAAAISNFNKFVAYGNWPEAEAMLSTAAKQKLNAEQKTLRESLLGDYKDQKIVGAETTNSIDRSVPGRVREDCLYKFVDNNDFAKVDQRIIPLVLVNENSRLVIDSWETATKPEEQKKEGGAKIAGKK